MATFRFLPLAPYAALLLALHAAPTAHAQSAGAYMICDHTTGAVLEERNSTKKLQVGSLTKVATAMVVLDWAELASRDLGQKAIVSSTAVNTGGSNPLELQPGDEMTLRDLIYAALMQSDNVAATVLAEHVGAALYRSAPSSATRDTAPAEIFVGQMNALARKLRMERTLFTNPHGLDSGRKVPYSTAADMARLTRYAMAKAGFRFYVSQKERKISFTRAGQEYGYLLRNTNELLGIDAVDGVKTGMTRKAGECVIVSATRPSEVRQRGSETLVTPRRIHVVVLGAADRFGVASQLLARGWSAYESWAEKGRPVNPKQAL